MHEGELSLERWANFFVVTSAAAATLVGLLFVVITLAADRRKQDEAVKIRVYLTPVVLYFSSVLGIGAILTIPNHTPLSAAVCVCSGGLAGLGYSGLLGIRGKGFYETKSDPLPYAVLPFAAYVVVTVGGFLLLRRPPLALDLVAAGMLGLLGLAIRNSWAIAVSVVWPQI